MTTNAAPNQPKKKTESVGLSMDAELMNRLRNAVHFTPGATLRLVVSDALELMLRKMEKQNGGPFDQRPEEYRTLTRGTNKQRA